MCEFVIDNKGIDSNCWEDVVNGNEVVKIPLNAVNEDEDDDDDDEEAVEEENQKFIELDELPDLPSKSERKKKSLVEEFSLDNSYLITNYTREGAKEEGKISKHSYIDKVLEKSVIKPGFEKQIAVPVRKSRRALKRERKIERDKTKGKEWFNLPVAEITPEVKNDLDILKMRSVLDPKHHYKKNDMKVTPKYFQIGKVVEGAADFYSSRIPKSQRKKTLVDELLADSSFRAYQKKKYKEIVDVNRRKKRKNVSSQKKKIKKSNRDDWLSFD